MQLEMFSKGTEAEEETLYNHRAFIYPGKKDINNMKW